MRSGRLAGKRVLITGGSRGIGRASALALASEGCHVAINYMQAKDEAEATVRELEALGVQALAVQADVSIDDEAIRLVRTAEDKLGGVDILVNNAGIAPTCPLAELTGDIFRQTMATNLTSCFVVTQAALPAMRERKWGRLIFLSSIAAQTGGVIGPHYAASKAGILGLTHSYANLLAKEGITSNAIAPALIETDMVRRHGRARPEMIPIGRLGTEQEVADTVVLLATNGYMTGQTISLNGGWYMS